MQRGWIPEHSAKTMKVFISYRRNDSLPQAGRLHDALASRFGADAVFMDVEGMLVGQDFRTQILQWLQDCEVVLVVIGDGWLDAHDDAGHRRLDHEDDVVRMEIKTAFEREKLVVPILVGRATMPTDRQLPVSISALAFRHAFDVRGHRFHDDVDALIRSIEKQFPGKGAAAQSLPIAPSPERVALPTRLAQRKRFAPAVGIDLGTTYSVIAYLDDAGVPKALPNAEGETLTPSVVLFDGDDVVVGREAVKALTNDGHRVAQCAKRDMGARFYHDAIDGRRYPPEVVQAYVLKKLFDDARAYLGEFRHAVITVPAYFDDSRRKATYDAGYMAGLEAMDIINEPTAAALAYGFDRGIIRTGESSSARKLLVYDLGGGTFDVSLVELDGACVRVLAIDGDVMLGGHDWDYRLVDHVAEEFVRQHGVDPREDRATMSRLWRACEDAKRTLSARRKARVAFEYLEMSVQVEVSREKFWEITRDLVDRSLFTTRQTLHSAGVSWNEIDDVLLVGGSTRMPQVVEMLRQLSGKDPVRSANVDEAVAHGAALQAGLLLSSHQGRAPSFQLRSVNARSLGVVATDSKTNRKRNAVIIPRNTSLPVRARRLFRTEKLNQRSVAVPIVEGESISPDDCESLGECVIRDLPPSLPAGTAVEVQFRYGTDCRLAVEVCLQGTDMKVEHELIRPNGMDAAQRERWRECITRGLPPGQVAETD